MRIPSRGGDERAAGLAGMYPRKGWVSLMLPLAAALRKEAGIFIFLFSKQTAIVILI